MRTDGQRNNADIRHLSSQRDYSVQQGTSSTNLITKPSVNEERK
jgi:hypothetical protein